MTEKIFYSLSCFIFILTATTSCSSGSSPSGANLELAAQKYFQTSIDIQVNVLYEPGAEPYDGNTNNGRPLWGLLGANLEAVFQYRSVAPTIRYPTLVSQMTALAEQSKSSWNREEILALHQSATGVDASEANGQFYIYFLNGYFADSSGTKPQVLGVSIGGAKVIAMFKDVIVSSANLLMVRKFVEQSTLIHEMGHAVGFVNNGVPLKTPHQDSPHGAHTVNSDCVMYYANEGASDLAAFVQRFITLGSSVMWGPEVLADAEAFSR